MTLGQLLDDIRSSYLAQFRETIAKLGGDGKRVINEAAFRDENGILATEGLLSLPLRGDVFVVIDGQAQKSLSIDSKNTLLFEPFFVDWAGKLQARVMPFHWDACNVRVAEISKSEDWSLLKNWFIKWFDGEDARKPDEQGFCGVIHFLSDPKHDGSDIVFQVDFGSAPVNAFEELLDVLLDSGATQIEIGHDQAA